MSQLFNGIYDGKKVLVTGHTGFKGSWLCFWLEKMGAQVMGYSLPPPTEPAHFNCLDLHTGSTIGDLRDAILLSKVICAFQPEIVFHLAAQPIVRTSYADPVGTYASNVIGTLHVCEACRACPSVRALVAITTDKVYVNREWWWGYREIDPLGGFDPYSSSKACADILLGSYRDSFFNRAAYGSSHHVLLAVARAGNVIGGGDWAKDRLVPDAARAAGCGQPLVIRNPRATRPWQHVLECLSGYLLLCQKLLEAKSECATAFNFGPPADDVLPVEEVIRHLRIHWPSVTYQVESSGQQPHEARTLTLDCAKARSILGWVPVWTFDRALEQTALWYRSYYEKNNVNTQKDLALYIEDAKKKGAVWAQ
ncbi:MAG: CDP-glucose 4,6-dehydratase [Candidatus Raymondbacteria bacterium RifOxyC12_full_50_8]|uniref:CDP-glucose 4,6-dehydratase n=1 Tax=Candidatus Raymondbacteria bacterium RIFOXYD12_FULL_49_13 TaxID=1817890 RepID=A0A1F7F6N7_UNCRA|nr:MAG: CDP-glucose 4,6-dehydratase [Candidatus Raymondbacteria bacterium RifOxyB12_full_50_8]OGJ93203.1 MAG: CDP-glucose 4,6-dehydratase [Candidatus Raymondbacteria bacterium RIFOXYA2_FULL_49_16]OGJ99422.1 MAG: CDP-glucose 4,6-dehydratase [Candidatus Raymondbacteria bacterium RifOxyC12_full_50_8]OGK02309.1 MAG: CDP-glucose 4,6-dehydratase [Candidatus Raymondbacteria bacterium RIFOXYD12_FULL_49_13]OGP44925.1 MAG: CDP-glucose 4,6-dehydratase [Candidatus Raymondbacteria bacterium RIFOXYB2_FULL_49